MAVETEANAVVITVNTERDLRAGLQWLVAIPGPAVVLLRAQLVDSAEVHAALSWWAAEAVTPAGLSLVAPAQALQSLRAVAADLSGQGAVVAAFSERDLLAASEYALREWSFHAPPTGMQLLVAQLRMHPGCSRSVRRPPAQMLGRPRRQVAAPG